MNTLITKEELKKLDIEENWYLPLNKAFTKYGITDKNEVSVFISQCAHESRNFTRLEESFNYTPERLFEVFKSRVKTIEKAKELVKMGPKHIANFLYNGRMGNSYGGDDGYNYRGRGIIQLTGKYNYDYYGKKIGIDLINYPALALDYNNACLLACAYWTDKNIGLPARRGDVREVTKIINGGENGLKDRERLFLKTKAVMNA